MAGIIIRCEGCGGQTYKRDEDDLRHKSPRVMRDRMKANGIRS